MHPITKSVFFGVLNSTALTYAPSIAGNTYYRFSRYTIDDVNVAATISFLVLIFAVIFDVVYLNKLLNDKKIHWIKSIGISGLAWALSATTIYFIINISLSGAEGLETLTLHLVKSVTNGYVIILSCLIVGIYGFLKPRLKFSKKEVKVNG